MKAKEWNDIDSCRKEFTVKYNQQETNPAQFKAYRLNQHAKRGAELRMFLYQFANHKMYEWICWIMGICYSKTSGFSYIYFS
jgi:hypothetical protein